MMRSAVTSALSFVLALTLLSAGLFVPAAAETRVPDSREQISLSFAPVVKRVAPAVVNVYSERRVQRRSSTGNPFFDRFFGMSPDMQSERMQNSLGSGVIVSADGVIVTNNHVIKGGEEFTIVLNDRREFDAEVVLADERTDLAILRIDTEGEKLPFVEFRDSDSLEVGDLVLAIGNPFGVGQTVTSGIISALARTQVGVTDYQFFIQTDAAINPGNSGGALVDSDGKLIGINTAIYTRSGGSNGIGFAVPANMVRLVVDSGIEGRDLVRPWLGAGYQKLTSDLADGLGLRSPTGALLTQIFPRGPADRAGLKSGDVVTRIDGFEVTDPQALRYRVATMAPGKTVPIAYLRGGRERTARITLQPPPDKPEPNPTVIGGRNPFSGARVVNLSPAFNEKHGLDPLTAGVIVSGVERGSYAHRLRLRPGTIILEVNGAPIETVQDLERAAEDGSRSWDVKVKIGDRILNQRIRL